MVQCCSRGYWARLLEQRQAELSFAVLLLSYALYLLFGAGVFSAVELPYEHRLREQLRSLRLRFVEENPCVSDDRLEELLSRALQANNYGVSVLGNDSEPNWDFISSLFFTSTVLTTTGYGHTVPLSDGGKAFCVLYSLVGIPITLIFLSATVQRIMVLVTRRPVDYLHTRWAMSKSGAAAAHALALSLVAALLLLLIPTLAFRALETSWSFLESLYFCFISLTTIGLGDYVPGETHRSDRTPHRQLYRLAITVYLLLGLVCTLVVVETWCELPQLKSFRKRFYKKRLEKEIPADLAHVSQDSEDDYQLSHQMAPPADKIALYDVSAQAASLRQEKPLPFTLPQEPASPAHANHLSR